MKDYYSILGLTQNATYYDIAEAYRKLSSKYHPDLHGSADEGVADHFKEIQEAYENLSNGKKRREHDAYLSQLDKSAKEPDENLTPEIEYFLSDKSEFGYGDKVMFRWKAINSNKTTLKPFGVVKNIGSDHFEMKEFRSKALTFELIAENTTNGKRAEKSITLLNKSYDEFYSFFKKEFEKQYQAEIGAKKTDFEQQFQEELNKRKKEFEELYQSEVDSKKIEIEKQYQNDIEKRKRELERQYQSEIGARKSDFEQEFQEELNKRKREFEVLYQNEVESKKMEIEKEYQSDIDKRKKEFERQLQQELEIKKLEIENQFKEHESTRKREIERQFQNHIENRKRSVENEVHLEEPKPGFEDPLLKRVAEKQESYILHDRSDRLKLAEVRPQDAGTSGLKRKETAKPDLDPFQDQEVSERKSDYNIFMIVMYIFILAGFAALIYLGFFL